MKLISWNVNGLRSTEQQVLALLSKEQPEILMIQELKAFPDQLTFFLKTIPGYKSFFNPAKKAGYSGTAIFYKDNLSNFKIEKGLGEEDDEGRNIVMQNDDIIILNSYTPNARSGERIDYKKQKYDEISNYITQQAKLGKTVILGGDLNVCPAALDIYSEKRFKNKTPILPFEREWFQNLLNEGLIDTFRYLNPEAVKYSWSGYRDKTRAFETGFRIDYFLINQNLKNKISDAKIMQDVYGSDHCPISLEVML